MIIRQCIPEDAPELEEIFKVLYQPEQKWSKEKIRKDIEAFRKLYFMGQDEDCATGAFGIEFQKDSAKFGPLVVREEYRSRGMGLELLDFAEKIAARENKKKIWCHSLGRYNVSEFYQRNGWFIEQYLQNFFESEDCFVLAKEL